jgi:hypothetical protein
VTEASEATDFGLVGFSEAFIPATMAAITLAITDTAPAICPCTGPPTVTDHTGAARIAVRRQSPESRPIVGAPGAQARPDPPFRNQCSHLCVCFYKDGCEARCLVVQHAVPGM